MMMDGNSRNNKLLSVVSLEFCPDYLYAFENHFSFFLRPVDRGEMVLICTKSTKFVVKVLNMKLNLGACCEQLRDRSRQGGATGPRSGREQVC